MITLKTQKSISVLFMLTLYLQVGASQNILNVPLLGQKKSDWCWAACMDMILEYYAKTYNNQCSLAYSLEVIKTQRSGGGSPVETLPGCCYQNCTSRFDSKCNYTIDFSKRDGYMSYQYVDQLFSSRGFRSVESVYTDQMNMDAIEEELNSCRPFIVFLNKLQPNSQQGTPFFHTVVGRGGIKLLDDFFLLVNDPLKVRDFTKDSLVCEGCEFLLPASIFSANTSELNSALEIVSNISPLDEMLCEECETGDVIKSTTLLDAILANSALFSIIPGVKMANNAFLTLAGLEDDGGNVFDLVDQSYLDVLSGDEKKVSLLISMQTSPQIAFQFEEIEDSMVLKGITLEDCTSYEGNGVTGSFNADSEAMVITMDKLDIIQMLYGDLIFYRTLYKGRSYLIPAQDFYRYKKGILYPETQVIRYVRKVVRKNSRAQTLRR